MSECSWKTWGQSPNLSIPDTRPIPTPHPPFSLSTSFFIIARLFTSSSPVLAAQLHAPHHMSGADMLHCGSDRMTFVSQRRVRTPRFQEAPPPPPLGLSLASEQLPQELYGHCPRYQPQPADYQVQPSPFSSLPTFPKPWLRTTDSIWRVQLQSQTNKRDPNAGREKNIGVNEWSGVERALLLSETDL